MPQLLGVDIDGCRHDFHIETFHLHTRQPGRPETVPPEHRHQVYHVVLYVYGAGNFRCGGRLIDAGRGTLVLMSPTVPHCFCSSATSLTAYHELTFSLRNDNDTPSGAAFDALFNLYFAGGRKALSFPLMLSGRQCDELEEKFFALERALRHYQGQNHFFVYRNVAELLQQVYLAGYAEPVKTEAVQPSSSLITACRLLEQDLHHPLRLREVTRKIGTSPEHFCREFKRVFGVSPMRYRMQSRITAAERLLAYSSRPLKEIAAELGFTDEYHFSKIFKKINGAPPGNYRATCRASK